MSILQNNNDNQSRFNKTRLDEAAHEYYVQGARLFRLLYIIIIVEIVFFFVTLFIGCIVSFSSMAILGKILEAIYNSL